MAAQLPPSVLCVGLVGLETIRTPLVAAEGWGGSPVYFSASYAAAGGRVSVLSAATTADRLRLRAETEALSDRVEFELCTAADPSRFRLVYDDRNELVEFEYEPGSLGTDLETMHSVADRLGRLAASKRFGHLHICPLPGDALEVVAPAVLRSGLPFTVQLHFSEIDSMRDQLDEFLARAQAVFMNRSEAAQLVGSGNHLEERLGALLGVDLFVTDRAGVSTLKGGAWHRYESSQVQALEPTGAGDAFAGGALAALTTNDRTDRVVRCGMEMAVAAVRSPSSNALLRSRRHDGDDS